MRRKALVLIVLAWREFSPMKPPCTVAAPLADSSKVTSATMLASEIWVKQLVQILAPSRSWMSGSSQHFALEFVG